VAGELYIGGAAVALGYLDLPDESRRRFIRDPFRPGNELLYRTGDICRYENGGVLEFVGRTDQQIKLRGFRIEPAEVEAVLKTRAGIKNAVVVKRLSKWGEEQIVAYLVLEDGTSLSNGELRSHLSNKLPIYMIPAHFVRLDSFPLTGSGKIDRRRLPDPAADEFVQSRELSYVAPRTPMERFLAACWCNLLHVEKVSIQDNFFDLGGHSLSATQLVSRIRDEFNIELPLHSVFERPAIELLALEIVQRQALREDKAQMETMLSELESLSEEDLEELLSETTDV
jgi:acyl carrier protein